MNRVLRNRIKEPEKGRLVISSRDSSMTVHTGNMDDTFGAKGFTAPSIRHVS